MRWWRVAAVLAGLGAVAAGVWIAVVHRTPLASAPEPGTVVWLVALGGLGVAAWVLYRHTRTGADADAPPWSSAGPIVQGTPEAAPQYAPLSGRGLEQRLHAAATVARTQRNVEAGLAEIRPLLRDTYLTIARHDGLDDADATARLDRGEWTDRGMAAAALSAAVTPPRRRLRVRVRDWLYPGRAVQRRVREAVDALAEVADETVTPVVGTDAPRQVPVHEPSLASRTRLPGGRLDGAVPRTTPAPDETAGNGPGGGGT